MLDQAYNFRLNGEPVSCERFGNGHINDTYLLIDSTARKYVLQKINKNVFRNPDALMGNIMAVTSHLRGKVGSLREVLELVPTKNGEQWLVDEHGEYWRSYIFIPDSICVDQADSAEVFRESAIAFGRFHSQMADFEANKLVETIPRFHDTPRRYTAFKQAVKADPLNRARTVQREIDFALDREEYASTLMDLQSKGDLPLRVTHNDTKLNNVLFDHKTKRAVCIVDLDTVMPGLIANDFGDSIRFGATTGAEDERDLGKVEFSLPFFEAYADGFLSECGNSLTECEMQSLRDGAKMMTLECGVRFLTDYIAGDIYFHIDRESHNLDRCRTQFKLIEGIETNWDRIQKTINHLAVK